MLPDHPIHDLTMRREGTQGANLVLAHQPGIGRDISRKDGR
jgi:hypothetical protein